MKRLVALLVCVLLLLSGCTATDTEDNGRLRVVTTIFPIYDLVRAVGGDNVDITLLIDPGTEVHTFDPAPSDVMAIQNADCFFYIGGESDTWVNSVIGEINILPTALLDCAEPIEEHHGEHGHEHIDEHIWTSPYNAIKMLTEITAVLADADPENADIYSKNAESYGERISGVAERIKNAVSAAKEPFLLIADRNPYEHFAHAFGIECEAAFGGCAASTDISLKTMKRLVETVNEKGLKSAFYTEMSSKNIANALAEETGVALYQLNSAHNVTKDEFERGVTYVDLMEQNAAALEEGWGV